MAQGGWDTVWDGRDMAWDGWGVAWVAETWHRMAGTWHGWLGHGLGGWDMAWDGWDVAWVAGTWHGWLGRGTGQGDAHGMAAPRSLLSLPGGGGARKALQTGRRCRSAPRPGGGFHVPAVPNAIETTRGLPGTTRPAAAWGRAGSGRRSRARGHILSPHPCSIARSGAPYCGCTPRTTAAADTHFSFPPNLPSAPDAPSEAPNPQPQLKEHEAVLEGRGGRAAVRSVLPLPSFSTPPGLFFPFPLTHFWQWRHHECCERSRDAPCCSSSVPALLQQHCHRTNPSPHRGGESPGR